MAEEIINIEIIEDVENINIVVDETIEEVTISIQEITNTSDLINDGKDGIHPFITLEDVPPLTGYATTSYVDTQDALKVDKVIGKGLSTNDYTNTEKTKLAGIQDGATNVTKTSDLINDGDNGISHFISLEDLPSNIVFYPTNVASDISGYVKIVTSITDPSYNTTAVDISTGAITTTNQLISSLATSANIIVGNPGVFNITTIGNIRRISGSGEASFFFRVYKRTLAGVETLIATSDNTIPVIDGGTYVEFSATAIWNDGIFLDTDRVVMKYYANIISGGSNPTYQFQFGGVTPVRTLVPIPLSVVPSIGLDGLNDVAIATPTNEDFLRYDSTTSLWKNTQITASWLRSKLIIQEYASNQAALDAGLQIGNLYHTAGNAKVVIEGIASYINAFKIRVATDSGTYSAESCQTTTLTALNNI